MQKDKIQIKGWGLANPGLLKGLGLPDPMYTLSYFSYNKHMVVALVVGVYSPPLWYPLEIIFMQKSVFATIYIAILKNARQLKFSVILMKQ